MSGLVPERDALSGLVIGTAYSPQHRDCPYVGDHSPHAIPFRPRPETVIENNVEPQREATSPDRLHNVENCRCPILKRIGWRVFAKQACHPFVRRETDAAMLKLKPLG